MFTTRLLSGVKSDPLIRNLVSFSLILFFIFLGDAILSFWVPNFLQRELGDSFLMGVTMSFSSVVGFGADIIFPQLLKGFSVRKLMLSAILVSFAFIGSLILGLSFKFAGVFLISMAIWGIYYEFIHFASQQFVSDSIPVRQRSSSWAIIDIFKNLAYFLGPILAGYLIIKGELTLLSVVTTLVGIGLLIFAMTNNGHRRKITIDVEEVNMWREIGHWKTLFPSVWTLLLLSLTLGLIDATFWTTGAVWTEELSNISFIGSFILPAYQLPSLFAGIILTRLGIFKGKKRLAEKFLLTSGAVLSLFMFTSSTISIVLLVFISSMFLALAYPLVEAVYSDITARMGIERKHLVGLSASTISLAYIISPSIAGYLASTLGEKNTFVAVGFITIIVSLILLLFTPKKIHLPEKEIEKWKV